MAEGGFDPSQLIKLIEELQELNKNLREAKASTQTLCGNLKDMAAHTKAIFALGKQVSILNQILLQVSRRAGVAGMVSNLFQAVAQFASRAKG